MSFADMIQTADWKKEKHVPAIEAPEMVTANEAFNVTVGVGRDIPHPNTTEHFIAWIDVFFKPEGEKFSYHVGHFDFRAHGESAQGANKGPVYTDPVVTFSMSINKPGKLVSLSWCNAHGLWEDAVEIKLAD